MSLYMKNICFLQPFCQNDQISMSHQHAEGTFLANVIHPEATFQTFPQKHGHTANTKTDFKFSWASEHFNNSSSFSLATARCLTLHKNPYPLSVEKATQKTNIKVFTKGLLLVGIICIYTSYKKIVQVSWVVPDIFYIIDNMSKVIWYFLNFYLKSEVKIFMLMVNIF